MSITKAAMYGGDLTYDTPNSGAFSSEDSDNLSRTFTAGNRKTWTFSSWVKRTNLEENQYVFAGYEGPYPTNSDDLKTLQIKFHVDDTLQIDAFAHGHIKTDRVFRDTAQWLHLVITLDTTEPIANDRVKIFVNGVEETSLTYTTGFTLNADYGINGAWGHTLGKSAVSNTGYQHGYDAETYFIDGQALTPDNFAEADPRTNQWNPKRYTGSYGANGFYLNFQDDANLGKDNSGNGNDWINSGVMQSTDTPTDNHCTFNPLFTTGGELTLSNAGRTADTSSYVNGTQYTHSGKTYFEYKCSSSSTIFYVGLYDVENGVQCAWRSDGVLVGFIDTTSPGTLAVNDVVGIAFDGSTRQVSFYKNGSLSFTRTVDIGYVSGAPCCGRGGVATSNTHNLYIPENSWLYSPPSGFKALSSKNLAENTIRKPEKYFNTVLWDGTGSTNQIDVGFQPDLVWNKRRNGAVSNHGIYDSTRGAGLKLNTDSTSVEYSFPTGLSSFDATGFTVESAPGENAIGDSMVAWNWKKGATSGFDIIAYTGDGVLGRTVSHSLGATPSFIMVKKLSNGGLDWACYHAASGSHNWMKLNAVAGESTAAMWGDSDPDNSLFTVSNFHHNNGNGVSYIAYLFAEVEGFSKFGSYTGSGSADGPFIHCGFRPAYVMVKRTDSSGNWAIIDSDRNSHNPSGKWLLADKSDTEYDYDSTYPLDFLSNGFKCRDTDGTMNGDGGTYIYIAFAESPFKYSRAR